LHGIKPPIWRRLRLPAAATLAQLHQVIQAAFGWEDAHLHAFEVGGRRYSRPDFELWDEAADEGTVRLQDLAARPGARLRYTYDFGDSWEHDLLVESILPTASSTPSASPAGVPAHPRTVVAYGATASCAASSPTPAIQTTPSEWSGWGALTIRPPSTRTRSTHRWRGFGSADRCKPAGLTGPRSEHPVSLMNVASSVSWRGRRSARARAGGRGREGALALGIYPESTGLLWCSLKVVHSHWPHFAAVEP